MNGRWIGTLSVGVALASFTAVALSQDAARKPAEKPAAQARQDPPDWHKLTAPDENHKRFEALVGSWKQVVRIPSGEGGKFDESAGTATYRWILGGRFLVEEVKCQLQGEPFEWMGIYGFDKTQKKYTAVWVDNLGTGTDLGEAAIDPSGKTFAFSGEQTDPMSGRKSKFRWVITLEAADRVKVEMFEPGQAEKEEKVMEILQTRAK